MCGIAAIFTTEPGDSSVARQLAAMHDTLAHRGPDGEGFVFIQADGSSRSRYGALDEESVNAGNAILSIACRRLSIQDPSPAASLPLASEDARFWIALNGEIYNFKELRRELEQEGHRFQTRGDAEVALAAYQQWGNGCWERFNGMWAILIADLHRGKLVGCRDRLGIKPLFHALDGRRLLLASEPKAIALAMSGGPRIQPTRLHEFLRGIPPQSTSHSIFEGIHPVPGGTWFEVKLSDEPRRLTSFTPFWNLAQRVEWNDQPAAYKAAAEELIHRMGESVKLRMQSDFPVGSFLSGGLDSSTVTRLAVQSHNGTGESHPTISLIYDDPEMDESRFIDAVLQGGGTEPFKCSFHPEDAWAATDACIDAQGEPVLGWDLIAQHHAYSLVRERGVKVLLEGQGGDELLGGYAHYEFDMLRDRLDRGDLLGFGRELRGLARMYGRPAWRVLRFQIANRLRRNRVLAGSYKRPSWLVGSDPGPLEEVAGTAAATPLQGSERINRSLFASTMHTNLPAILLHQDRNSMAHGIESRVPFLDHHVVEFCFSLPGVFKVHDGQRKRILREAGRKLLPQSVLDRTDKKAMISSPTWFPMHAHGDDLRAAARDRRLGDLPWIDLNKASSHVEGYLSGKHKDHLSVWRLHSCARWLDLFKPSL